MDVLTLLSSDHQEQQAALRRLIGLPHDHPDQGLAVHQLTQELIAAASKHEAVEETWLWPEVRERFADGDTLVGRAMEQEREAKVLLHEIGMRVPEEDGFTGLLERYAAALADHVAYEERTIWPRIAAEWSDADRDRLGVLLERGKRTAPTRPHPAGPESPAGLKTVGRVSAWADRLLDVATGRNRPFEGHGHEHAPAPDHPHRSIADTREE